MQPTTSEQAIQEAHRLLTELKRFTESHDIALVGVMEYNTTPHYFDNGIAEHATGTRLFRALTNAQGDLPKFLIAVSKNQEFSKFEINYTTH